MLAGAAQTANPVFQDLSPVMYLYLGVGFAVLLFLLIIGVASYMIAHAKPKA